DYVPSKFKIMRGEQAKRAYVESLSDSERQYCTEEVRVLKGLLIILKELFTIEWNFRFKMAAGRDWTRRDPWWNNELTMRQKYLPSGIVQIIPPSSDKPLPEYLTEVERKWRWVEGAAGRTGPRGSFLQDKELVGDDVEMKVHMSRGFIMESCWVLLTGFDMPPKGERPELEDENLRVTTSVMHEEATAYNIGVQIPFFQNLPAQLLHLLVQHGALQDDSDDEGDAMDNDIDLFDHVD
ncbi:hypothetical protein PROFUN_14965, partial [Planoprotostelium fungivorum]